MSQTNFKDLIADHINGHLTPEQVLRLEQAIAEDPDLAEQVRFERTLQVSVRADQADAPEALPHFAAVREHIEQQQAGSATRVWSPLVWWAPAFAAVLVVVVGLNLNPSESAAPAEYRTLSNDAPATQTNGEQAHVRVVAAPGVSEAQLRLTLVEYGLNPVRWHEQTRSFDVLVPEDATAEDVRARLAVDARIRFVDLP